MQLSNAIHRYLLNGPQCLFVSIATVVILTWWLSREGFDLVAWCAHHYWALVTSFNVLGFIVAAIVFWLGRRRPAEPQRRCLTVDQPGPRPPSEVKSMGALIHPYPVILGLSTHSGNRLSLNTHFISRRSEMPTGKRLFSHTFTPGGTHPP